MDPALALEVTALARQKEMTEAIERGDSEIQHFYDNSTVFVTGASGFLGKQLVEKLLRSCPNVKKIFVLLRSKKGKSLQERQEKILRDPVYESLRKKMPNFGERIQTVEGDITQIRLGLSDENWLRVTREVEMIFHVAATTNFDMPLKSATLTNVRGTREVLKLAKESSKLRAFVYVSTAYSHATYSRFGQHVKDDFYPAPLSPSAIIELVETIDENRLIEMTPTMIADWPNTYSFTKAIAEQAVKDVSDALPLCIVRPSIVTGTNAEPAPGWIDISSVFGPSGILLGVGIGAVHVCLLKHSAILDLIPVDLVNNAILAAGWETARRREIGTPGTKIYSLVSSTRNPLYAGQLAHNMRNLVRPIVSPKAIWYCFGVEVTSQVLYFVLSWIFHFIPAYIADAVGWVIGKKLNAVKLYTQYYKMSTLMGYYTLNYWKFEDTNTQALIKRLSDTDRRIFRFDVEAVDWKEHIVIWYMGLRKYIIKDELKDTDYGLKKQFWLMILNYIVMALYFCLWWKVLSTVYSVARMVY